MKIVHIKVIPNAGKNEVIPEGDRLKVKVGAPAANGRANAAVIKTLVAYFKVKPRKIIIIKGEKSREKKIGILP